MFLQLTSVSMTSFASFGVCVIGDGEVVGVHEALEEMPQKGLALRKFDVLNLLKREPS